MSDAPLKCLNGDIKCFNKDTNATECLNLMYFCESYQKEVFCDNHKDIDDEILKNMCLFYKLNNKPVPFYCGQSIYISKEMVRLGFMKMKKQNKFSFKLRFVMVTQIALMVWMNSFLFVHKFNVNLNAKITNVQ